MTRRYVLPNINGEGWVVAFVDDETWSFAALSDWGNVAYRWGAERRDFRRFLCGCDDYYLTSKLGQGRREYDPDLTLRSVKVAIVDARRWRRWSREDARDEWGLLREFDELQNEIDFGRWFDITKLPNAHEHHATKYDRDVTCFVKYAMPRLRAAFEAELAREAA